MHEIEHALDVRVTGAMCFAVVKFEIRVRLAAGCDYGSIVVLNGDRGSTITSVCKRTLINRAIGFGAECKCVATSVRHMDRLGTPR